MFHYLITAQKEKFLYSGFTHIYGFSISVNSLSLIWFVSFSAEGFEGMLKETLQEVKLG